MATNFLDTLVRRLLLVLFAVLTLFLLGSGASTIINYFLQFQPNKVSAELPTTIRFSIWGLGWGMAFLLLFATLLRRVRWFPLAYWLVYLAGLVNIALIVFPHPNVQWPSDVAFLTALVVPPATLGIYLTARHRGVVAHHPESHAV